ncbi:hypothetical protein FOYG_00373 [Fusarium oxysporum NRRL 32931]|uniref:Uncharacterized protein n=1 Tax=Fusarium oxysporum NRRL 32931 TaxID=660029 RepID=W9J6P8_FUSOX|nr:hypothetical protein FOYG_00373 [Fusarium oxysporum NRRL 32931]
MSELIDKVSEENATLKEKIKTQKSALIKQKIALKEEKDANKQLKSDVASMMRRLVAVEEVVHPAMCEAAEQKWRPGCLKYSVMISEYGYVRGNDLIRFQPMTVTSTWSSLGLLYYTRRVIE